MTFSSKYSPCAIALIQVYLTGQFLFPMLGLYSYRVVQNPRLRAVAKRTFSMCPFVRANGIVGTVATLCSSIANISAVFALKGHEAAFVTSAQNLSLIIDLSRMLHSRCGFLGRCPSL